MKRTNLTQQGKQTTLKSLRDRKKTKSRTVPQMGVLRGNKKGQNPTATNIRTETHDSILRDLPYFYCRSLEELSHYNMSYLDKGTQYVRQIRE